ncbi:MAG TPA: Ppx/GppA family phosphatase, partial [Solirubrobacteraceae bacterium]|nr:Ppx/GppA family phosphatase [Solirubrobacteraceae bacterium]
MRIAVLDIGSNTTRLYIADVQGGQVTAEHERISRVTRLGQGVDANGHLAPEALEREHRVLADYRAILDQDHAEKAVAIMTSAVRDAADGREFADDVAARYGVETHILTGDEEARLSYLGATSDHDHSELTKPTLVVDIGGGSTEIV